MLRKIIHIDDTKCDGCGLCAAACKEAAIAVVNGKAKLLRDDYCDGLGNCLPACPRGAISFVEREAAAYDDEAVRVHKQSAGGVGATHEERCPSAKIREFNRASQPEKPKDEAYSALRQWPVQLKLASVKAAYFAGSDLLVAADCTAYAYGRFHQDFMAGRVTLIGCPKLDMIDYTEKLTAILKGNDVKSVTVARMEVPCCGGIERAVRAAVVASGKDIPCHVRVIGIDGQFAD